MFIKKAYSIVAVLLIMCIATACEESSNENENVVAFVDVNVVPMDSERILEHQTVIVKGDRIDLVGKAGDTEIPEEALRIEGGDRYLMPGLTEMHGHVPGPDDREYLNNILFLYLSNGVTTVRNMAGNPYHIELRDEIRSGRVQGPTLFTASPWLGDNNVPSAEDVERVVEEYHEAGFDLLKIGSISPEAYDRMAEKANELGIPFGGHIPEGVGLERALEAGQKSIDHLDRYIEYLVPEDAGTGDRETGFFGSGIIDLADTNRIPEAVEKTIEANTWNVPTLSLVEHLALPEPAEQMIRRDEMKYMPQDILDDWVQAKQNFKERDDFQPEPSEKLMDVRRMLTVALYDAGAPMALGSDAPQFYNVPGFSIHHEMQMMVNAGLTPYDVLVTGTRNPAEYFGKPEEFGTVTNGRRADLILLNANPLEDINNVKSRAGVMVRGEWIPESDIQQRLEEIAGSYGQQEE